jgi:hypothetical protein
MADTNEGTEDQGSESANDTEDFKAKYDALMAEHSKTAKELAKVTDEAAKNRVKARETKEEAERQAAIKRGEFEEVAQKQEGLIQDLRARAERWDAYESATKAQVEEQLQGMDPDDADLVRAVQDPVAQSKMIARLSKPSADLKTGTRSGSKEPDSEPPISEENMTSEQLREKFMNEELERKKNPRSVFKRW